MQAGVLSETGYYANNRFSAVTILNLASADSDNQGFLAHT